MKRLGSFVVCLIVLPCLCFVLWPEVASATENVDDRVSQKFISNFEEFIKEPPIEAISVPRKVRERITKIYDEPTPKSKLPHNVRGWNIHIEDELPFSPYWQAGDRRYRFHPLHAGSFVTSIDHRRAGPYLTAFESAGVPLDNGGVVWVFPDTYDVSRVLGRFVPSAYSQAHAAAKLAKQGEKGNGKAARLAVQAYEGLKYPYKKGGVNLLDRVFLEIPIYNGPPEIVLNGWLHALLFLHEYAETTGSQNAQKLLRNNVRYMAKIIEDFHDPETGLSRYSDLTPYQVKIVSDAPKRGRYWTFYESHRPGLPDKAIELQVQGRVSPYENHLSAVRGERIANAWVSLSQGYETYIVSDRPFHVTVDTGAYDPMRATPPRRGDAIKFDSTSAGDKYVVKLKTEDGAFFRGYPTNFAKSGKENFYHVYHVVALAYILTEFDLEPEVQAPLAAHMRQWYHAMKRSAPAEGASFTDPSTLLANREHEGLKSSEWKSLWARASEVAD